MRASQKNKQIKLIAGVLGLLVIGTAVYFGIKDLRANTGLSDFEQENGQVYYSFFLALERYTLQTHALPASLEEFRTNYANLGPRAGSWPDEGDRFESVVGPDFSVAPVHENLARFAPGYADRSFWAQSHCEALWELIVGNCQQ